jgi:UDP-glucose 4-epimerase
MSILVTGGAGFIGSHMVELLLREGYYVIVIDNLVNGSIENVNMFLDNSHYQFKQMDIIDMEDDSVFENVDYVFHMAALADIVPSVKEPVKYFNTNVLGTIKVLEACRKYGIKKLIYSASSSCYGIPEYFPTCEIDEIKPQYPYALTKATGEQYALFWGKLYDIPVISLRYFNVYGPRGKSNSVYGAVFKVFLKQKLEGKPLTIVGNGEQKRDFIYVTDVVRANFMAAKSNLRDIFFNVGTGKPQSINYLADLIGGNKVYIPKRPGEPDITHADITLISAYLGWEPIVSFEDGVSIMLENINYWKDTPLWNPENINEATKDWFKYLR